MRRHFFGLAGGTFVAVVLILWDDLLHWGNIPAWIWVGAAVLGLFISGFNAWREEHAKVAAPRGAVDPEMALRRPRFEEEIAKLSAEQGAVLRHVVQVGDSNAVQLRDSFFREQDKSVSPHDANLLLLGIAETTNLLEPIARGTAFPRYAIKPVWEKLLVEWAAPPTAIDRRIADKALALRRTLDASFDDWPTGMSKFDDFTSWAGKLLRGFDTTDRALKEIVDLRPEASRRVERAVGTARDEYDAAADVVNRFFKKMGGSTQGHERPAVEAELREAERHVHQCVAALDSITRDWS